MVSWLARCHASRAATRSPIAEVPMIQNGGVVPRTRPLRRYRGPRRSGPMFHRHRTFLAGDRDAGSAGQPPVYSVRGAGNAASAGDPRCAGYR